ncbi:MAG: META domain-containing protein, partial [Ilumatobacteraceae bacterium]
LALVALVAVPLASCGSDDPDTGDTSAATGAGSDATTGGSAAGASADETTSSTSTTAVPTTTVDLATSLDGRTFLSTAVEGYQLVDGAQIQLTFDGADVAAAGGCNQIASTWSLEGAVLVVTPPAMTMMACEPAALMDQDTWFSAVLTSKPTVSVNGDELTIAATDGTVVTFLDQSVADPDLPLEGTTWSVDGLVSGDAASSIPAGGRAPSLRLDGGTITVDTGCNTGSGTYTLDGTDITFGPIATTRMACADPAGSATETAVLTVLSGTATYEVEADVLRLTNGTNGLMLRAAPEGGTTPEGLEGAPWLLDSYVTGSTTTAVAAGVQRPTLQFDATTGTVAVEAGCNSGSGTYAVAGDQITFGPLAMTTRACVGESATVETAVLAVLTGTATAQIVDGVLTLTNGSNGLHYLAG